MKKELIDVMDKNMNIISVEDREKIHKLGLIHQTFHCWIIQNVNGNKDILFQKRSETKDTFPNLYDITCAGHLSSGETPLDGIREVYEELGIKIFPEELVYIGVIFQEKLSKTFIDREFSHVYLCLNNIPITNFNIQLEEVKGIFKANLDDVISLVYDKVTTIKLVGFEVDKKLQKNPNSIYITKANLVPHSKEYFDNLFKGCNEI